MEWQSAPDIEIRLRKILSGNLFPHVKLAKITALRGVGSTSRAIARIWSLPRPWQLALKIEPQYIIEVIAQRFDKLSEEDKNRTLIHELMHIPKTFSGALVPHRNRYRRINSREVEKIFSLFRSHV